MEHEAISSVGGFLGVLAGMALGAPFLIAKVAKIFSFFMPQIIELWFKRRNEQLSKDLDYQKTVKENLELRERVQNKDIEKSESQIKYLTLKIEILTQQADLMARHSENMKAEAAQLRVDIKSLNASLAHVDDRVNKNTEELIILNANLKGLQSKTNLMPTKGPESDPRKDLDPPSGRIHTADKSVVKDLPGGLVRVEERKPPPKKE